MADKERFELGSPISFIDAKEKQEEKPGNYCILVGWLLLPRDCAHRGGTGSCRLRLRMCFTVKNLFGHSWWAKGDKKIKETKKKNKRDKKSPGGQKGIQGIKGTKGDKKDKKRPGWQDTAASVVPDSAWSTDA